MSTCGDLVSPFWRVFLRRFFLLLAFSAGLVAVLYVAHAIEPRPVFQWLGIAAIDFVVLLAASAVAAWLKIHANARDDDHSADRDDS